MGNELHFIPKVACVGHRILSRAQVSGTACLRIKVTSLPEKACAGYRILFRTHVSDTTCMTEGSRWDSGGHGCRGLLEVRRDMAPSGHMIPGVFSEMGLSGCMSELTPLMPKIRDSHADLMSCRPCQDIGTYHAYCI